MRLCGEQPCLPPAPACRCPAPPAACCCAVMRSMQTDSPSGGQWWFFSAYCPSAAAAAPSLCFSASRMPARLPARVTPAPLAPAHARHATPCFARTCTPGIQRLLGADHSFQAHSSHGIPEGSPIQGVKRTLLCPPEDRPTHSPPTLNPAALPCSSLVQCTTYPTMHPHPLPPSPTLNAQNCMLRPSAKLAPSHSSSCNPLTVALPPCLLVSPLSLLQVVPSMQRRG